MQRFRHSLSNYRLSTFDMGFVVPIGQWEVLPTDLIQGHTSMLLRMSPMAAPVMHPVTVETFTFFTPYRLLWNKEIDGTTSWEDFITGGPDGMDTSSPPTISTTATKGNLLDHLGLPLVAGIDVNAMPLRSVNTIWNEWFRDQDLQTERALDDTSLPMAAWPRDYFNTARPWTQKGPNVTLPLGGLAGIQGIGVDGSNTTATSNVSAKETARGAQTWPFGNTQTAEPRIEVDSNGNPLIYADLANADAANINDVRRAYAIQRFQEARAAWGSRYVEYLKSMGANPADARLQRPELISSGRAKVSISEVLQTAPETGSPPTTAFGVGDMYGHGISALRANKFRKAFQEHGILQSFAVVRPRTLYQDGIDKHWLKKDKEDYFQKELQYIGQQNVHMDEIYADPTHTENDIFAYQDRYREYRETPSKVCGDFRDTLDFWHLGRQFSAAPALNDTFIQCDPSKRIFNVQSENTLWVAAQHKMTALRQVAKNAVGRIL